MIASRPVPGPRRVSPVGHLIQFRRDPLTFLTQIAREHGDVAHFTVGPQDLYLLNHPDYVKDVLVTHNRNFTKSRALERAKRLLGEGLLTSGGEFHQR